MQSATFYHIYNHANGSENLFRSAENYRYFLQQWSKYIEPIAGTYAYCLMPNHIHFLIRTKSEEEVLAFAQLKNVNYQMEHRKDLTGFKNLSGLFISKQFSNMFNAFAKAYNKQYNRKGSLFMRPFKSKEINSEEYLTAIVNYIHRNPIHHGFHSSLEAWPHSSYSTFLSNKPTKLQRDYILDWFNGVDDFKQFHHEQLLLFDTSLFIDF